MLMQDKVVMVAGVGSGMGRSIALASAREGADVVLAARTASQLDEVAKEVAALGRRALAVPCDLTDPASAEQLATAAQEEFGRVDAMVYNALAMPPIEGFGTVPLEALSAAFDANVLAALRLTRQLIPSLAENKGSVVMVGSMVMRFSEVSMGPYKLIKTALHVTAQNLAAEYGPSGVRFNTVVPGQIWGDTLRGYFGYLAQQRGDVTVEDIYDEVAAKINLRRLPENDEVADAVLFLISDLARAVTGQALDVNGGEYHH
ncbi:NAD(P)-dependent dehydrogenase (short-subunit alcohol dehydrogenase family) [Catenulispora sp. GAS73]|uniref:SDR family oxidoreductase n=1 Tax=Catenulispora sp. GAS73 TaxID=3156269 RepID=UPI0035123B77